MSSLWQSVLDQVVSGAPHHDGPSGHAQKVPRVWKSPQRPMEAHAHHAWPVQEKDQDFQRRGPRKQPRAKGHQKQGQRQGNYIMFLLAS